MRNSEPRRRAAEVASLRKGSTLIPTAVECGRQLVASLAWRWPFRHDPVVPRPKDFRGRTLPVLVWWTSAAICLGLFVLRYEIEYLACDREAALAVVARAYEGRIASLESLFEREDYEDAGSVASTGLGGRIRDGAPTRGSAAFQAPPRSGIWWPRPVPGPPLTERTPRPLPIGDETAFFQPCVLKNGVCAKLDDWIDVYVAVWTDRTLDGSEGAR